MSYRDLQESAREGPENLFDTARRYAHYLWLEGQPARAILALCRAIYLDPRSRPTELRQPYEAYVWLLRNYAGAGFLGNPRISFLHQAVRMPGEDTLKRSRAWALWYLTLKVMPDLATDPAVPEDPPTVVELSSYLDKNGLRGEGTHFTKVLDSESQESG